MPENIIVQLIVGFVTIIASILAVTLVLAKKLPSSNCPPASSNGRQEQQDDSIGRAHTRIDEFQVACSVRHEGIAKDLGAILANQANLKTEFASIKEIIEGDGKRIQSENSK